MGPALTGSSPQRWTQITDVAEPPTDNPDAELELTPQDLAQKWIDRLNSIQTIRFPRSSLQSSGTPLEFLEKLVAYQDLPVAPAEDREADENPETETTPGGGDYGQKQWDAVTRCRRVYRGCRGLPDGGNREQALLRRGSGHHRLATSDRDSVKPIPGFS